MLGVIVLSTLAGAVQAGAGGSVKAVEADDLVKLTAFVGWPATVLGPPDTPFNLCILGPDPFGPLLDHAAEGAVASGRPVVVRRVATLAASAGCRVAFVAASPDQPVTAVLQALRGQPVLTVTDQGAPGAQGVVDFVVNQDQVRFDIDDQSAADRGLSISSKLLSLALTVRPRK